MNLNKRTIIFVLQHLKELRQGEHIEQHLSYLERPLATRRGGLYHAPFENPCLLAGEVENRLAKCGRDGFLCKVHYALDESEESLAKNLGLSKGEVKRGIVTARKYISYKWPKQQNYQKFKWRKR